MISSEPSNDVEKSSVEKPGVPSPKDDLEITPPLIPIASDGSTPLYDAIYYAHGCGEPYERNETWLSVNNMIAGRIVNELRPRTVLDAGCAMGFLVEALRQRGVQAWGIDISRYAVQQVNPDIQPFCQVSSILEPFPLPRFDLIVCVEVLEHLPPEKVLQAVENLTRYADDILLSSTPFDFKEPTHLNIQPPEYWTNLFYRCGFIHDVDYDASYIAPWTLRFRRAQPSIEDLMTAYERKLWLLKQESVARRDLSIETKKELIQKEINRTRLDLKLAEKEIIRAELNAVLNSRSWRLIRRVQWLRERIIPIGSRREVVMHFSFRGLRILISEGLGSFLRRLREKVGWQAKIAMTGLRFRIKPRGESKLIEVDDILINPPAKAHNATVDVIICVHNALADVSRCLESVLQHTTQPYTLILVDDGSAAETRDYLVGFARQQGCQIMRNEQAKGYTLAANQGLHLSSADFSILLNSDTIVTPGWVDRMLACAQSDPKIGVVGPLSNCATWQSIPEIIANGEWADNPLPPQVSAALMGEWVAGHSWRLYPRMQFLNGFCLLIRRAVIEQVGYFDEELFGIGYGEENDYCLRCRNAGWLLTLADDTYVYHAQSRSYNQERRQALSERANRVLAEKHGQAIIDRGTADCRENRLLQGIRAHSRYLIEREELNQNALLRFKGKKVVFVLPIWVAGGGANVVVLAAQAMRRMGVDAHIINLHVHRVSFENAYRDLDVPILYGNIEDIPQLVLRYDAVVATFNPTISWIAPALEKRPELIVGYYIQDYEPYFYQVGTPGYQKAADSYTLIPNLVRGVTTQWIYDQIQEHHRPTPGQDLPCTIIGASFDTELFWPRPRRDAEWPERPIRISAMIRPHSERRSPQMTMQILQQVSKKFGAQVEFKLFGTKPSDPGFEPLPKDFPWQLAGELRQNQIANLLNEVDIFVDFSVFQGLGLTAMESMSCGCAAIIPQVGGGSTFACHGENCLVVDTQNPQACLKVLQRLIENHELRQKLQRNGISAALQFHPELPTYRLLEALFPESR
jgi:GT2 family glycosyltransferase/SAM-dependent methyltransferase